MNVTKRLIEDTVEKTAGKDLLPVVRALNKEKHVSEFKLASHLKKDINETRNMLYRLCNQNLVSSIKRKDKQKGWYIYYWSLNLNRMKYLAEKSKDARVKKLKKAIANEKEKSFFLCSEGCARYDFEKASELGFRCSECGKILHQMDNTLRIKKLEKELKNIL